MVSRDHKFSAVKDGTKSIQTSLILTVFLQRIYWTHKILMISSCQLITNSRCMAGFYSCHEMIKNWRAYMGFKVGDVYKYGFWTMFQGPYLGLCPSKTHQTWSNDQSQHDLSCGGVSFIIDWLYFENCPWLVPHATPKNYGQPFQTSMVLTFSLCLFSSLSLIICTGERHTRRIQGIIRSNSNQQEPLKQI